jgi:hypothetical protein
MRFLLFFGQRSIARESADGELPGRRLGNRLLTSFVRIQRGLAGHFELDAF